MNDIKQWEEIARDQLGGRKIVAVRYLTDAERDRMAWTSRALVIFLDNGTFFFPASDDEGNNAGALFTSDKQNPIIPVCR